MVMAAALIDQYPGIDLKKNHHVYMNGAINEFLKQQTHHGDHHDTPSPKQLIGDAMHHRVQSIDFESCEAGDEDTFYVCDLGEVYRQHMRWKLNLPRVKPFYGTSDLSFPSMNPAVEKRISYILNLRFCLYIFTNILTWTRNSGQVQPGPQAAARAQRSWHRL